jgi:hypothetical protein
VERYVALSAAVSELLWIKHLLCELGLSWNIGGQTRAKHIALRHHLIQDKIESKEIELVQASTLDYNADGFAKPLPLDLLEHLGHRTSTIDNYIYFQFIESCILCLLT